LSDVAEISVLLGRWDDARAAVTELAQRDLSADDRVVLVCQMALLAGLSGDEKGAANHLEGAAAGLIATTELVAARTTYLRTRSLLSLAADDLEAARQEAAEAVSSDPLGINSPHALMIQARAAIWLRDVEGARSALSAMTGFPGSWMAAERLTVEAGVAALGGLVEEAAETYREAIEAWRALECTLDLALCELDLVLLLGPGAPHDNTAKEAGDIFMRLGAKPFLERLNRAAGVEQAEGRSAE
jgi:hypothetical protein